MKYYLRLKQYKASNVAYNIESETATSYEWYILAKRINGIMVVNSYNYSSTTIRHLYKIRALFSELNIEYIEIEAPRGLQALDTAKNHYKILINDIQQQINKPRSRKSTNEQRINMIAKYNQALNFIQSARD